MNTWELYVNVKKANYKVERFIIISESGFIEFIEFHSALPFMTFYVMKLWLSFFFTLVI